MVGIPGWLSTEELRAWQAVLAAGALLDRRLDQQLRQEADVRGVVAAVTGAGRQRLARVAPGHVAAVRGLLIDVLTAEQLAAMANGLGEVARRLGG